MKNCEKGLKNASKVASPCLLQACFLFAIDVFLHFDRRSELTPFIIMVSLIWRKVFLRLPYLFKFIWKPPLQRLHFNPVAQSHPSFIFLRACTAAWHFLFAWTDMTSQELKAAFFLRLAGKENAKWSLDRKWSRNWTANDPETQMIPDVARKCTRKPVSSGIALQNGVISLGQIFARFPRCDTLQ